MTWSGLNIIKIGYIEVVLLENKHEIRVVKILFINFQKFLVFESQNLNISVYCFAS